MSKLFGACLGLLLLLGLGLGADGRQAGRGPAEASGAAVAGITGGAPPAQAPQPRPVPSTVRRPVTDLVPGMSAAEQTKLVAQYCVTCHSERGKAGGLSLASFDAMRAQEQPEIVEKMIRKIRAGMMPPAGAKRPEPTTIDSFTSSLERRMDEFAALDPNPGWRPFQRLTRVEYQRAVRDLLDVDVDVTSFLPADTISHGFDNIADSQSFSPSLLEGYLRAASQVSRLAVGDPHASPTSATYRVLAVESQMRYVDGAPFGSRGGISVVHTFGADGSYVFKVMLVRTVSGELFGNTGIVMAGSNELLEISVNGDRVAVLEVDPRMSDAGEKGLSLETPPIHIRAGPQRISAVFVPRSSGPVDDLMVPIDHTLIDTRIGTGFGITAVPHLQDMVIAGPMAVTGISDTPSRRRIFSCRPTAATEESACARDIIQRLARQAFRGPVPESDLADLTAFYDQGRNEGDFETGIRLAVQGILANPRFLFRVEQAPAAPTSRAYRITDVELASRLSFFLWGTVPDAELVKVAMNGTLKNPTVLDAQVRRMLADERSAALATRFGSQWLHLQDVDRIRPDGMLYPYWDRSLSDSFRRETELFFENLLRENRSVLDLLTADYSFVDERLARHYGIPNVTGTAFRRVSLPENRRGILTQGSFLMMTSVADRTSPVQRGKWVLQVLLGAPPPPPPPNVPAFEETKAAEAGKLLSVRERMEQHRANPACMSCHKVIDPIGLALENYDVTGQYRMKDNGVPVDATGELYDGTRMEGPAGLRNALLKHKAAMLNTFTESLMTYAIGRRVEAYDMPTVRAIVRDAEKHDHKLASFIVGVVKSPAFQMSRTQATETADQAR